MRVHTAMIDEATRAGNRVRARIDENGDAVSDGQREQQDEELPGKPVPPGEPKGEESSFEPEEDEGGSA